MVMAGWKAVYSSCELQRIAEHGDQSQDEIGEKTPCDGWGQWCFAQRNKKKQRWNPCVICHHHPFEGKFAGRTVYVKSLDMCFCALCHVHHLVDTNQTPCKGDGCVQERARCARLILALRTGQVQNEALPPASPAWRPSWPQAVAWPETGTQMATEHGMDRRRQAYGVWQMETGWIAAAKSAAAARDADGHRDRSFFQQRADLDASHCDLEQNRGSCESIKRARHRAGSRH